MKLVRESALASYADGTDIPCQLLLCADSGHRSLSGARNCHAAIRCIEILPVLVHLIDGFCDIISTITGCTVAKLITAIVLMLAGLIFGTGPLHAQITINPIQLTTIATQYQPQSSSIIQIPPASQQGSCPRSVVRIRAVAFAHILWCSQIVGVSALTPRVVPHAPKVVAWIIVHDHNGEGPPRGRGETNELENH